MREIFLIIINVFIFSRSFVLCSDPDILLQNSISYCNKESFDKSIHDGADINASDIGGPGTFDSPPLNFLVWKSSYNANEWEKYKYMAEVLILKGARMNTYNRMGEAPLHTAVLNKNMNMIKLLLLKGADINFLDKWGNSSYRIAVNLGFTDISDYLAGAGADKNSGHSGKCVSLLNSIENTDKSEVEYFLSKGANPNYFFDSVYNNTNNCIVPLSLASLNGDKDIVELLILKGADVNPLTREWETPISEATNKGHTDIVKLLLAKGARPEGFGLFRAAEKGYPDIVRLLLENGSSPNYKCKLGTPLITAAEKNNIRIVRMLLEAGADANLIHNNMIALNKAIKNINIEMIKLFLSYGAEVKFDKFYVVDSDGEEKDLSPISEAKRLGNKEIIMLLDKSFKRKE